VQEIADFFQLGRIQSEGSRDTISDEQSSPSSMFSIPPIDPLLQLGRSPRASETRRDCDEDFHELGVVVLAVGVCEHAEDLVFDEGEVEVEDVEVECAHLIFRDFPRQLHNEQVVHLPAGMRQIVYRHRYEAQSLFLTPEWPLEALIDRT
jgi:hypothetical protein